MTAIFLSYRRADTSGYAGRLADALEARLGPGSVFQDVETIAPGANFEQAINTAVANCEVLIVLIGNTWASERAADGRARLDDPRDFVRLEVASALRARKPILPVLVEGASMPPESALPHDLRGLHQLQAIELSDSRWDYDVGRVETAVQKLSRHAPARGRRRTFILVGASAALLAVAAATYHVRKPADVSGRWNLANGSYWTVAQTGSQVSVEETHYQSKEVWKRGTGTVGPDGLRVNLDLVYGNPIRYEAELQLSPDGRSMRGQMIDTRSRSKVPLTLTRGQ